MTEKPDKENIWSWGTGAKNSSDTRMYKSVMGYDKQKIVLREKYFDGRNMDTYKFRSPWRNLSDLFGTDALQFPPNVNKDTKLSCYLDQIYRSGDFIFNKSKKYQGMDILRFT